MTISADHIEAALLGLAIGDALGVPVEFQSRESLDKKPVTDMRAYGTHHQAPGTWSDDTSLTLCLADNLTRSGPKNLDLADLCQRFCAWRNDSLWTAHDEVFDIGIATSQAIDRMAAGEPPVLCGGFDEYSNGNGSLMRILPLAFWLINKNEKTRRVACFNVSAVTHAHSRSKIAAWFYVEIAMELLRGCTLHQAISQARLTVETWLEHNDPDKEWRHFDCCTPAIASMPRTSIQSSGYVLHTLEASLWCLLTTQTYTDAVLAAVNLGNDTDTSAAVTGGLAGIIYGLPGIPSQWIQTLSRHNEISALAKQLSAILHD